MDSKKYIMIGGNDPEMAKAVMEALQEKAPEAIIYELDNNEMSYLAGRRADKVSDEVVVGFLEDEQNKAQAKEIARQFFIRWEQEFSEGFVKISEMKKMTNFSWSKFNNIIATLDMFGFISWEDEQRKALKVIMDQSEIKANKRREIQLHLDVIKGKLIDYQKFLTNQKDIDKLETMKKRMVISV
jgi:hypothetical protein